MNVKEIRPVWKVGQEWAIEVKGFGNQGPSKMGPPSRMPFSYTYHFRVEKKEDVSGEEFCHLTVTGPTEWDAASQERYLAVIRNSDLTLTELEWFSNSFLAIHSEYHYDSEIPAFPKVQAPLIWPVFFNIRESADFHLHAEPRPDSSREHIVGSDPNVSYAWLFPDGEFVEERISFSRVALEKGEGPLPAIQFSLTCRDTTVGEVISQVWVKGEPWWVQLKRETKPPGSPGIESARLILQ